MYYTDSGFAHVEESDPVEYAVMARHYNREHTRAVVEGSAHTGCEADALRREVEYHSAR